MKIQGLIGVICLAMIMWLFMFTFIKIRESHSGTSSFKLVESKQFFLFRCR